MLEEETIIFFHFLKNNSPGLFCDHSVNHKENMDSLISFISYNKCCILYTNCHHNPQTVVELIQGEKNITWALRTETFLR